MNNNLVHMRGKIYTKSKDNLCWYGENTIKFRGDNLREWNPKKSKIGAAIKKNMKVDFEDKSILYLGSSTGTTISHLADLTDKPIISVDVGPIVLRELLELKGFRENVVPLLYDASKLKDFNLIKGETFDIIFEDIAQRNMTQTFIENMSIFSHQNTVGLLSLKTRSIDSTKPAKAVLEDAKAQINKSGLKINKIYSLEPFEKEHYVLEVKLL